ncbi:MAG TPA: hypothetical protein VK023_07560 [Sphingobacterium bovisgrunnientis]|jgi:hypothetical protein|nr:hypothetical protein [Sphingobacterium bovisgrunnientis]
MGPGFESQRDHKKKLNLSIELFFCPEKAKPGVRFEEGSSYACGQGGAEPIPAGSQKASLTSEAFFVSLH